MGVDLDRLTGAVARATGSAADALMAKLAETQESLSTLQHRQRGIAGRQAALDGRDVDPAELRLALAQFTDIWHALLTPERERVVRLLIDRVDYDGPAGQLKLTFAPGGIGALVTNVTSAEQTS